LTSKYIRQDPTDNDLPKPNPEIADFWVVMEDNSRE